MSRLCRLKSYQSIGDDGVWAYAEITMLRERVDSLKNELEAERECRKEVDRAINNSMEVNRQLRAQITELWKRVEE